MNLFAFRKHLDRILHPIVSRLATLPLHANAWTLIGAVIGLVGGVVFFYGHWWAGLALLLVRGLIDHIDGFKARTLQPALDVRRGDGRRRRSLGARHHVRRRLLQPAATTIRTS